MHSRQDSPDVNNVLIFSKCYFGIGVNYNLYSATFTLGKEPTLIVPNWQSWAIKHSSICSEPSSGWDSEPTQRSGSGGQLWRRRGEQREGCSAPGFYLI